MVDVTGQIEAVDRATHTEDVDGVATRVQTLTQTYPYAIGDVWDAITTAERIERWFLPVSGDLRLGGRYQLEGNAGGTIEECAPPAGDSAHFRVTWEFGGGAPTWLTIRLTALAAASTRLDLIFTGRLEDVPAEMWQQFGPSATGMGWDSMLLGLALYVGGAQDGVSPAEAAAWVQSDEGKQFMRLSADAWRDAHIADGADPDQAQTASDATYALYTSG
ncbi:MAG TPA: SRPBCC domain-containing protein [Pseudolysinimonas sp.]|jgi:uncharacterized protein YndB with AHSA1/START domain|nr:SRPBCC domain-containing protein [Pseudolysinimonas sp.]